MQLLRLPVARGQFSRELGAQELRAGGDLPAGGGPPSAHLRRNSRPNLQRFGALHLQRHCALPPPSAALPPHQAAAARGCYPLRPSFFFTCTRRSSSAVPTILRWLSPPAPPWVQGQDLWTNALPWSGRNEFNAAGNLDWWVDGEVAGTVKTARNFTHASVFDAGHMVRRR